MHKLNIDLKGIGLFGKMTGGYFITTLINNAIPFLVLPILTRYLAPAQYANVALFSFYLALSNALTGTALPAVISKYFFDRQKNYIAKIIGNSVIVVFGFSALTFFLILLFYPFLHKHIDLPLQWMLLIPLASFAWIILTLGLNVLRNSKKVIAFTAHQVGNTVINFSISLLLIVVLTYGWEGRAWGIIISYLVSAVIMFIYLKVQGYVVFDIRKTFIRKILGITLPLIPNSFQSVIISQVGIFFVQYFYTKELLGIYSVGFQIAFAIKLLVSTFSYSWSPFLYEQLAKKSGMNKMYVVRMFYMLLLVLAGGVVFVNLFAKFILMLMTTPEYYDAIEFIPFFTIGFFFFGVYIFLMPILIKLGQQKFIRNISFINMILMLAMNITFVHYFGYMGIVYAFCLTYFIMAVAFFIKSYIIMPLPYIGALKIWN